MAAYLSLRLNMLNDTTEFVKYSKHQRTIDRQNYITDHLVNILYSSPKAFVYILKLACSDAFNLTENDVHRIINNVTKRVEPAELELLLQNVDDSATIELKHRPEVSSEVMALIEDDGFQLAVLLARHVYGDMSETNRDTALRNEVTVKTGAGIYATSFNIGDNCVLVTTQLPSYQSAIELH